jgi:hypothetical protein
MRERRAALLAFMVFLAAALLATYPLLREPGHTIAGGLGDPIIGTTVLAWDADRMAHGFRGLWDAPFFFPYRHTLAYMEHLLGVAVFTAPVQWLFHNPVLAYNLAYIASYVLAGFGMFLLTRSLWHRADAALLAGLAFALTPYRLAQSSHLQVLMNGWMPIGLWALHQYFASGSRRWMAGFVAAYLLSGLSNGYYLYFFLLPVAVLAAGELARPRLPRVRMAVDFAVAGAAIAAAMAPIAFVYFQLQREHGFVRPADQLPGLSARLGDYFRTAPGGWTWGALLPSGGGERQLFQGFVVLLFATLGACTIGRRDASPPDRGTWGRAVGTYLVMAALAVWLSMGPGTGRPYGLLFRVVPGLNGLRVPARLAAVVIIALSVLAGAGFAWFLGRLSKQTAAVAALAIAAVIVLEGQHGIGVSDVAGWRDKSWDRVAYEWLRSSPPGGALELNITEMDDFHPFTTIYELNALEHRHPIVNGYAGWKSNLQELLGGTQSPLREPGYVADTLRGLRRIGVRYVLLHERTFTDQEAARRLEMGIQAATDEIDEEHRWPEVWAWRLKDIEPRPPAPSGLTPLDPKTFELHASHQEGRLPLIFDGDLDTRWMTGERQAGVEWIEIRLPRPSNVGRLQIVGAGRTILDYPRHLRIDSIDPTGVSQTLFDDRVIDRYVEGVAVDDQHPSIAVDLPRNQTATLRILQTAQGLSWWSIHDLTIWERREER